VPPAVRVLSPARAPRGLHRALFMNSVSHGKIWTKNAASLWKGSIFLKRACLVVSVQESTLPHPPVLSTLFFQLPIKGHKLCLRGGQLGGGGGGGSHQTGQVYCTFVTWSPPPPKPMVQIHAGPWTERLLQSPKSCTWNTSEYECFLII
jgi:hypothetical protein